MCVFDREKKKKIEGEREEDIGHKNRMGIYRIGISNMSTDLN